MRNINEFSVDIFDSKEKNNVHLKIRTWMTREELDKFLPFFNALVLWDLKNDEKLSKFSDLEFTSQCLNSLEKHRLKITNYIQRNIAKDLDARKIRMSIDNSVIQTFDYSLRKTGVDEMIITGKNPMWCMPHKFKGFIITCLESGIIEIDWRNNVYNTHRRQPLR